ncbi:hypothetical protein [Deinococcus planocerae]|uniref:hypothetical protein n=1 Tax=Deinococcus planocerae TaxID=1737569 RepID=UPI000C7EF72C|nr:hypothetical protein [Deinococcus planocerae]
MTRSRTLPRLVPAALILSVALMACNQQGTTPPAERMNALVLGPVQSAYFDALRPSLNLVQYTGSQNVKDYDVLIFDGDAQSPQALQADPVVEQAVRAGKWVLGMDLTEAHKQMGFESRLSAVNGGTSPGWLVRAGSDANGRPAVWMVDAPKVQASVTPLPPQIEGDAASQLNANTNAFANTVMARLRAPLTGVQDTPVPPDLITATYYVSTSTNYFFKGTYQTGGTQTTNAQYDYIFHVYLDNANNPQGNFQWVVAETEVAGNPTSGTGNFGNLGANGTEMAWFLDRQTVSLKPSAAFDSLFTSFGSSPATANGVSTVTTGTTFTVGYNEAQGFSASYTYSNSQTRPLQDWKLSNESSGNAFAWYYRSNNPLDADSPSNYQCPKGSDCSPAWITDGIGAIPNRPNPIAISQLQLHTQAVWKTNSVLTDKVTFELGGNQGTVDLYGGLYGGGGSIRQDISLNGNTLTINMACVVPIPLTLTFDPPSVTAGLPVTGTITLASPAVVDTTILLQSSDPVHAPVDSKVVIPRNQTSAKFVIRTDPSGAPRGSVFKPTIRAFYGGFTDAQLTITY